MSFAGSYLGKLRQVVGDRLLLVVGARIFIEDDAGRVLMQKRSDFGTWGFLGGLAEPGEALEATIRREVYEESGLNLGKVVPIAFSGDPAQETLTYPNGHQCQFFCLMFWAREFSGEMQIRDDETLEFAWHGPDQFPPMLKSMAFGLECFKEFKRTGQFQVR